ncbi:RNA polymerase sigma factor [Sphingobacterium paramultivorum]|uniref:RNA polymerase sigma factor n=1 Tax=Sphingobacterium paramultivorum TaxID=2886510 RepID=UPI00129C5311|nr:sigma-70 family RNA polymerase sigma factor [Sphingobacterium paramultivorum]
MIEQYLAKAPKRFLGYAMSLTKDIDDANDIIQEAIISIWRSRDRTNDLNDGYFKYVLKQKLVDLIRSQKKNTQLLLEGEPISHNDALTKMYLAELDQIVDTSNPLHRDVFRLNMAGYKFREIAEILGIPEGTAVGSMRYIRIRIKIKLLEY